MNKHDFALDLFCSLNDRGYYIPKHVLADVVTSMLDHVYNELANGNGVRLHGVGNLSIKQCSARTCRNPRTGETMAIPAKKTVRFSPTAALLDELNK